MRTQGYMIADVETTIRNKTIGKNKAFPFYPSNKIVSIGSKVVSPGPFQIAPKINRVMKVNSGFPLNVPRDTDIDLMVGHNIKFDLHYLRKERVTINGEEFHEWLRTGNIWDTQQVEYILSGQSNLYPSLDQCSSKYGGTLKDDRIKVLWQAGVQTETIQEPMLNEYLAEDVSNTEIVFTEQYNLVKKLKLLPLVRAMNQAILAYQEMEYNGMAVDSTRLDKLSIKNVTERRLILDMIFDMLPHEVAETVNIGSTQQISLLLFGGDYKYTVSEKIGVYKTGKRKGEDKYKKVTKVIKDPLFNLTKHAKREWKLKGGTYQTSDYVLEQVKGECHSHSREHQFISLIQEFRTLEKERSGYYSSIPDLMVDGLLHQNINNCATHTGRLSQSDPNLQNTAKKGGSQVKSIFVSRFGDEGFIVEADYKQLEVISLAFLSQDKQLIKDILSGTDIHTETHKKVAKWLPSDMSQEDQRRCVKAVNFGLIYGGGANTLAKQSGLEVAVVRKIIKAFYARYPAVKDYQQNQKSRLLTPYTPSGKTDRGYPRHSAQIRSETGRYYTFQQYDNPPWAKRATGEDVDFSYTQLCNYECQGFATGDIVPTMLGYLFRELVNNPVLQDKCLMINTVHDSVIFDVHYSVLGEASEVIRNIMEGAPAIMKEVYDIDLGLPLKVEITAGPNWKKQTDINDLLLEEVV